MQYHLAESQLVSLQSPQNTPRASISPRYAPKIPVDPWAHYLKSEEVEVFEVLAYNYEYTKVLAQQELEEVVVVEVVMGVPEVVEEVVMVVLAPLVLASE